MAKLFLTIVILTLLTFNFAQAQDNIGLLPTNPFYFLKEWRRDLKGFFTVQPVKKAELELQIIREKSAEIKKLQLIYSHRLKLEEYAADLMERALRRAEFYFESGQKIPIAETMAILPFDGGQWESFAAKLLPLLEKNGITGLLWVKELEKIAPEAGRKTIGGLKENLLLRFLGQVAANNEILELLPKESLAAAEFLDDLKEYAEERADLKNQLNQIRQEVLNWAKENKKISRKEAERAIALSENLVNVLAGILGETPKNKAVNLLNEKAKFNLIQAKASLEANNYSDAFGQVSLASASAVKALNRVFKTAQDFEADIKALKAEYDRLSVLAKEKKAGLEKLFSRAESLLVKSADLLSQDNSNLESAGAYLEEVKILLAEIAALLPERKT